MTSVTVNRIIRAPTKDFFPADPTNRSSKAAVVNFALGFLLLDRTGLLDQNDVRLHAMFFFARLVGQFPCQFNAHANTPVVDAGQPDRPTGAIGVVRKAAISADKHFADFRFFQFVLPCTRLGRFPRNGAKALRSAFRHYLFLHVRQNGSGGGLHVRGNRLRRRAPSCREEACGAPLSVSNGFVARQFGQLALCSLRLKSPGGDRVLPSAARPMSGRRRLTTVHCRCLTLLAAAAPALVSQNFATSRSWPRLP